MRETITGMQSAVLRAYSMGVKDSSCANIAGLSTEDFRGIVALTLPLLGIDSKLSKYQKVKLVREWLRNPRPLVRKEPIKPVEYDLDSY